MSPRYDYIAVGHVTCDAVEHSARGTVRQPGGSAFYSALQAARLGLRTLILTQGVPGEIEALLAPYLDELALHVFPAQHTTTLSTRGSGASRTQRVLAWAGPIVDRLELNTAILHLAPIARETPVAWEGNADFVGITPQGLVRRWNLDEVVPLVQPDSGSLSADSPLAPGSGVSAGGISAVDLDPTLLPESFNAAVISDDECANCRSLFSAARHSGACVAVTAGSRPATVHLPAADGEQVEQTSTPQVVAVRDDLGAGDVFAAAFFIALAQGRPPLTAATFGNAAAAVRIAGVGPEAIGHRAEIAAASRANGPVR